MRLPRDISAQTLIRALAKFGYTTNRQTGSHVRLTTQQRGEHHVTIPLHDALRVGTLASVLGDVADHLGLTRADVVEKLFG